MRLAVILGVVWALSGWWLATRCWTVYVRRLGKWRVVKARDIGITDLPAPLGRHLAVVAFALPIWPLFAFWLAVVEPWVRGRR